MKKAAALLLVFFLVSNAFVLGLGDDISLSLSPPSKDAYPGDTVTFTLTVENTNPLQSRTVSVSVNVPPGWTASASPSTVTVPKKSSATVTITINVPSDATPGTSTQFDVITSCSETGEKDTVSGTVNVLNPGSPDVQLSASTTSKNADPSTSVSFTVTLKNNGTADGSYTISASDTQGWTVSLSKTSASLASGASTDITVTVSVPFAQAGTTDTITVTATESGTGISRSIQLTVTVNAYLSFSLSTSTLSWSGAPGGTVSKSVTVTVTSNKNFNVNVYGTDFTDGSGHKIPIGNFYADKDGNSPYDLTLSTSAKTLYSNYAWGQNRQLPVYFIVNIPTGLPAGTYTGTLYIDVSQV